MSKNLATTIDIKFTAVSNRHKSIEDFIRRYPNIEIKMLHTNSTKMYTILNATLPCTCKKFIKDLSDDIYEKNNNPETIIYTAATYRESQQKNFFERGVIVLNGTIKPVDIIHKKKEIE